MSNGHGVYKNTEGVQLQLYIDVDLKSEKIKDLYAQGPLLSRFENELKELRNLVLDQTISYAQNIKRSSLQNEVRVKNGNLPFVPLSLWLLHQAIEDYLGTGITLKEQNDLLCLCYGIGATELKKQILAHTDYDLSKLIADTFATSACGGCRSKILEAMIRIREEHGIIFGLDHSQSHLDKDGHWIKIKDCYPTDLLIKLDELKVNWMKREEISKQFEIEIVKILGYHLWLTILPNDDSERSTKILAALSDYWRSEMGALFVLHLGV